jgi:hypothetical protein
MACTGSPGTKKRKTLNLTGNSGFGARVNEDNLPTGKKELQPEGQACSHICNAPADSKPRHKEEKQCVHALKTQSNSAIKETHTTTSAASSLLLLTLAIVP